MDAGTHRLAVEARREECAGVRPCSADFVVGAKPLDEGMLSQLMLQLLQNHTRGIPAAALLEKVRGDMVRMLIVHRYTFTSPPPPPLHTVGIKQRWCAMNECLWAMFGDLTTCD